MSTVLNRSSVKKYALAVSAGHRAAKFSRVGEEFFLRCEARFEASIRAIGSAGPNNFAPAPVDLSFVTLTARDKTSEMLEALAQRIIYTEVLRHPSIGVTLK